MWWRQAEHSCCITLVCNDSVLLVALRCGMLLSESLPWRIVMRCKIDIATPDTSFSWSLTCYYIIMRANLELKHLKSLVGKLKESQRCLHHIQGVDHVGGHVSCAEVTGRHGAQLEERIQDAGEHLGGDKVRQSLTRWVKGCGFYEQALK